MTKRIPGLFVLVVLVLAASGRVDAQGTDESTQKASSGAKSDENKTAELIDAMKSGRDRIEITDALMVDFITGLRVEMRLRQDFGKELIAYKAPEQYQACQQLVVASEEMQQIILSVDSVPEGASMEVMQAFAEKQNGRMKSLLEQKCGAGNIDVDWPTHKRRARLAEIEQAGADAFDAAQAARATRGRGPAADENPWRHVLGGSSLYFLLKDRIVPFCQALNKKLIILDTDGRYKFSFSTAQPLSLLYTQAEAEAQAKVCYTHELYAMLAWMALENHDIVPGTPGFKPAPAPGARR